MKTVWLVTWHEQNGNKSGIHGVWADEIDACKAARYMTKYTPYKVIYRTSQWTVISNNLQKHKNTRLKK